MTGIRVKLPKGTKITGGKVKLPKPKYRSASEAIARAKKPKQKFKRGAKGC